jgi:hypothetical protein
MWAIRRKLGELDETVTWTNWDDIDDCSLLLEGRTQLEAHERWKITIRVVDILSRGNWKLNNLKKMWARIHRKLGRAGWNRYLNELRRHRRLLVVCLNGEWRTQLVPHERWKITIRVVDILSRGNWKLNDLKKMWTIHRKLGGLDETVTWTNWDSIDDCWLLLERWTENAASWWHMKDEKLQSELYILKIEVLQSNPAAAIFSFPKM